LSTLGNCHPCLNTGSHGRVSPYSVVDDTFLNSTLDVGR
jgi:hypothetical protein